MTKEAKIIKLRGFCDNLTVALDEWQNAGGSAQDVTVAVFELISEMIMEMAL